MRRIDSIAAAAGLVAAVLASAPPAAGQSALDRTPNLSGGWTGIPWAIHTELPHRFHDVGSGGGIDVGGTTTFTHSLGLPFRSLVGLSWAIRSPTVPDEPDELQPFVRHQLLSEYGGFASVALAGAWNSAAGSLDLEAEVARWFGPVRLLGAARWFSDARGAGEARGALAAGAVWHPLPGRVPIAVTGDIALPLDRKDGEDPVWGAGVQLGILHTGMTLSLQATNAGAATLQGASFPAPQTRWGFELAFTIPAGYLFGGYPSRDATAAAVEEDVAAAADVVVFIERYAFGPVRLVVRPGTVVEWVNRDAVVHTATAEDGAWDSRGIQPGGRWRARFDAPGIYPYDCSPHPYMKGVVIVRP